MAAALAMVMTKIGSSFSTNAHHVSPRRGPAAQPAPSTIRHDTVDLFERSSRTGGIGGSEKRAGLGTVASHRKLPGAPSPRHDLDRSAPSPLTGGRLAGNGAARSSGSERSMGTRRGQHADGGSDTVDGLGAITTVVGFAAGLVGAPALGAAATGGGFGLLVGGLINRTGIPAAAVDFLVKGGAGKFNPGAAPPGELSGDAGTPAGGTPAANATPDAADGGVDSDDESDDGVAPRDDEPSNPDAGRPTPDGVQSGRGARKSVSVSRDESASQPDPNGGSDAAPSTSNADGPEGDRDPSRRAHATKRRTKGRSLAERRGMRAQPGRPR